MSNPLFLILILSSAVIASVFGTLANKPTLYETLCLVESESLVTYRGVTEKPRVDQDGIWSVREQGIEKKVIGDCFYHPVK